MPKKPVGPNSFNRHTAKVVLELVRNGYTVTKICSSITELCEKHNITIVKSQLIQNLTAADVYTWQFESRSISANNARWFREEYNKAIICQFNLLKDKLLDMLHEQRQLDEFDKNIDANIKNFLQTISKLSAVITKMNKEAVTSDSESNTSTKKRTREVSKTYLSWFDNDSYKNKESQ